MSSRRYRVIQRMPWIEGGQPAPEGGWEGGKRVVYEPGDTIEVDDQELASLCHKLEAIDDAGRAALEEARAKAKVSVQRSFVADFDQNTIEWLIRGEEENRKAYGPHRVLEQCFIRRDGSKKFLPTQYIPIHPRPGVVYGDNGLPDSWMTAIQRERLEEERKLARIRSGASLGGRRGRETKRDTTARRNEALLADVQAYCEKHPNRGGPAIAAALVDKHGIIRDDADPRGREKAIEALRKRIERLKRALDK